MPVSKPADAREDRELAGVQLSKTDKAALADMTVEAVEGKVVGKKEYDRVYLGEGDDKQEYRLREKIGAMAMFKWSAASELPSDDPRALGAIYALLKSLILKEDWQKFEEQALDDDADAEELLDVITAALEIISGRPTKQS
jgi:hypothetical protein